jgi:hypothetical protein
MVLVNKLISWLVKRLMIKRLLINSKNKRAAKHQKRIPRTVAKANQKIRALKFCAFKIASKKTCRFLM